MTSDNTLGRSASVLSWLCQVIAAVILAQTLFFKFTGAEESVYIFATLGIEPWGRIGTGVAELVTVLLLLMPRTAVLGGVLGMGLMAGALMGHLTELGIVVQNDGGLLFGLAVVTFTCCAVVVALRRFQLPVVGPRLAARHG